MPKENAGGEKVQEGTTVDTNGTPYYYGWKDGEGNPYSDI